MWTITSDCQVHTKAQRRSIKLIIKTRKFVHCLVNMHLVAKHIDQVMYKPQRWNSILHPKLETLHIDRTMYAFPHSCCQFLLLPFMHIPLTTHINFNTSATLKIQTCFWASKNKAAKLKVHNKSRDSMPSWPTRLLPNLGKLSPQVCQFDELATQRDMKV